MKTRNILLIGALVVLIAVVAIALPRVLAQGDSGSPLPQKTDPQMLLIPRWFLTSMTVDGQAYEIAQGQQDITLQFEVDGKANGSGGCNSMFTTYEAGADGSMAFGPIGATKMFCDDNMVLESAYFLALSNVVQYQVEVGTLTLTSVDRKTELVFSMPPK